MVKSSVPHNQFDLYTNLQAVAVNVTLSKKVTICYIYLPPSDSLSKNSVMDTEPSKHYFRSSQKQEIRSQLARF